MAVNKMTWIKDYIMGLIEKLEAQLKELVGQVPDEYLQALADDIRDYDRDETEQ